MKQSSENLKQNLSEQYDKLLLQLLNEDLKRLRLRRSGNIPVFHLKAYLSPNKEG